MQRPHTELSKQRSLGTAISSLTQAANAARAGTLAGTRHRATEWGSDGLPIQERTPYAPHGPEESTDLFVDQEQVDGVLRELDEAERERKLANEKRAKKLEKRSAAVSRTNVQQAERIDALTRQLDRQERAHPGHGIDVSIFTPAERIAYGLVPANSAVTVRCDGQECLG